MSKKSDGEKKSKSFESKFEPNQLRELIQAGRTANEIMKEMKIGHMQTLRQYVLRLMDLDKSFYDVPGLYKSNTRSPICNFKGDIVIRKKMMERAGFTFKHGDEFSMHVSDDGATITLKLVENET